MPSFFACESAVRGYHIYQEIWEASCGQTFPCLREEGNPFDPFAVSVVRAGSIIGHVPKNISAACSLFLRNRGSIECTVTGSRRYSRDLVQGGLEVPCKLTFKGESKYVRKVEKLIKPATGIAMSSTSREIAAPTSDASSPDTGSSQDVVQIVASSSTAVVAPSTSNTVHDSIAVDDDSVVPPVSKKQRVVNEADELNDDSVWITVHGATLKSSDKLMLLKGNEINDRVINAVQKMLIAQFPLLKGLRSTLIQYHLGCWTDNYLQIVHSRNSHWILVSSIGCQRGEVKVYDSLYDRVDDATKKKIEKTFGSKVKFVVRIVQKQQGYKDCGLFSLAFATHLAFGKTRFEFKQDCMHQHLVECIEKQHISVFP